jgi:hypothetical protein
VRATEMANRDLVRNQAPANWPRESVEDGNDQLNDVTLDIGFGCAMVHSRQNWAKPISPA